MPVDFLSDAPWEALIYSHWVKMVGRVSEMRAQYSERLRGSFYRGRG
jgi:hypothetical protein